MQDHEFLQKFEDARLSTFPHHDHIRMAWLYLSHHGWDEGYTKIQIGLKHFATAHDAPQKYHETITQFWAKLVYHCIQTSPDIHDFKQFLETFPILLDKNAMMRHYSADVLWGSDARNEWIEPDLIAMS